MTDPVPDPHETAVELRMAVFRLARRLRHQDVGDLSPTPSTTLATIAHDGPITLGALAKSEHLSAPTITRVVERLIEDGLIERTVDPLDRRVARVAITPLGEKRLETNRERRTEWLIEQFDQLSRKDLSTLGDAARILNNLSDQR